MVDAESGYSAPVEVQADRSRGAYVVTTLPIYTALLVGFGTAARRGAYFQRFARRMWSRMLPMGK